MFSSIPDDKRSTKSSAVGRTTCAVINTSNEVTMLVPVTVGILKRVFVGSIVNIRRGCLFFWVHGGMNRSAEQTNRVIG